MTLIRVAVPVLQGHRRFHFDKARPWSIVEHMLLFEIGSKPTTASVLAERAGIPQRVIIEALIRLMHATWVEMEQRGGTVLFRVTPEGLVAREKDTLPTAPRRMSRNISFVVDQITGSVFRTRDLPFLHQHVVEERATRERVVWIDRPPTRLLERVRPLVEVLFQDDEQFIAMDAQGARLAERWALVPVRDGEPEGLTQRAPPSLGRAIVAAALEAPLASNPTNHPSVLPAVNEASSEPRWELPAHPLLFSISDLIIGGQEHRAALLSVLGRARHRVIIHSTFIDQQRFDDLMPALRKAISQGAVIDVMWGQSEDAKGRRSTSRVVAKLRAAIENEGLDGLRVHSFSTGSHAKLILADDGTRDKFVALVGSCNWFYSGFQSFEVSARLRDSAVVADVVDQLAELSRGGNGHWTKLTNELAALAADLRTRPSGSGPATASIVIGDGHARLVREARDKAKKRIVVASHKFGNTGESAVVAPLFAAIGKTPNLKVELFYGEPSGKQTGVDVSEIVMGASKLGASVKPVRRPTLHAKFMAWDDDYLVVTSSNWLSADTPEDSPLQEIGIFIHSPSVARLFLEKFKLRIT